MRDASVDNLRVGERLVTSVCCDYSYQILLNKGTVITEEHLEKLQRYREQGFRLFFHPSDVDGIKFELMERLPDKQVKKAYLSTFIAGKSIYENLALGNPVNVGIANQAVEVLVDQILINSDLVMQLAAVKMLDDYTFSHMVNVAIYAASFAKYLEFGIEEIKEVCLCGLLHDVGKAKLPENILKKPGGLSDAEFMLIKKHPQLGYEELLKAEQLSERVRQAALQHHERGDGSGYPSGLPREEISLNAKIISIVDVYDALTSDRCYRGRLLPHESAEILISDCVTDKLDTELVRVFLSNIARYPLGTEVMLSSGQRARVVEVHPDFPLRPVLETLEQDALGAWTVGSRVDLLRETTLFVTEIIS